MVGFPGGFASEMTQCSKKIQEHPSGPCSFPFSTCGNVTSALNAPLGLLFIVLFLLGFLNLFEKKLRSNFLEGWEKAMEKQRGSSPT